MLKVQGVKYYTVAEAAEILNVHVETIRRWARSGKIPCTRRGGWTYLFTEDDLAVVLCRKVA